MEFLVPMSLFFCVAAVLILRPITRRLGGLLEATTQAKLQTRNADHETHILATLEHMSRRLELMEERLDFTERLVGPPRERHRTGSRHSAAAQIL
jgi:hypothetical protein